MTCPTCGGAGTLDTTPAGARHPALTSDTPCPDCDGTGETDICTDCDGACDVCDHGRTDAS